MRVAVMVCDVKRCRQLAILSYAAFGARRTKEVSVCERHWEQHCDEDNKFDLRTYFYPVSKETRNGQG
jgi:hypothetical protein